MSQAPLLILVHSPLAGSRPRRYARRIAAEVARDAHLAEIVLAGHSGAGAYLPATG